MARVVGCGCSKVAFWVWALVRLLQTHDGRKQREEEPGQAGGLDQKREPTDQGREHHHELELVREQQRQQELLVLVLQVELLLLLETGLRVGVVVVVVILEGG